MTIIKELSQVLTLGGRPAKLLLGYFLVQIIFSRHKSDAAAIDSTALIYAIYMAFCMFYSAKNLYYDSFGQKFLRLLCTKTCMSFFVMYTVFCALSAFWSSNWMLTLFRAIECMGYLLLNIAVVKTLLKKTDEEGIMYFSFVYAFAVIFMYFCLIYKSSFSTILFMCQFPATIFFYFVFFYAPRRLLKWPLMAVAMFCKSTTGYIGMAAGLVALGFGNKKYRFYAFLIGIGLVGSIALGQIDTVLNETIFASKGGAMKDGKFQYNHDTTSGRSELWEPALDAVHDNGNDLMGMGFVTFETDFVHKEKGSHVVGMHNGFLSAFVGTGYVGLLLFGAFMIYYIISVFAKEIPRKYRVVLIASMCCVFFHTFSNPGLGTRVYGTWMYAMYIVLITQAIRIKSVYMKDYCPPRRVVLDKKKKMLVVSTNKDKEQVEK